MKREEMASLTGRQISGSVISICYCDTRELAPAVDTAARCRCHRSASPSVLARQLVSGGVAPPRDARDTWRHVHRQPTASKV